MCHKAASETNFVCGERESYLEWSGFWEMCCLCIVLIVFFFRMGTTIVQKVDKICPSFFGIIIPAMFNCSLVGSASLKNLVFRVTCFHKQYWDCAACKYDDWVGQWKQQDYQDQGHVQLWQHRPPHLHHDDLRYFASICETPIHFLLWRNVPWVTQRQLVLSILFLIL